MAESGQAATAALARVMARAMNPVLRKLSRAELSDEERARLLEQHIGIGQNPAHCQEAIRALERLRGSEKTAAGKVLALFDSGRDPCALVRQIITLLRGTE